MPTEFIKSKIKWHCRRGMLELDLFLENFINAHLDAMTDAECAEFDEFLKTPDPILFAWFMGHAVPEDMESLKFVTIIRSCN